MKEFFKDGANVLCFCWIIAIFVILCSIGPIIDFAKNNEQTFAILFGTGGGLVILSLCWYWFYYQEEHFTSNPEHYQIRTYTDENNKTYYIPYGYTNHNNWKKIHVTDISLYDLPCNSIGTTYDEAERICTQCRKQMEKISRYNF